MGAELAKQLERKDEEKAPYTHEEARSKSLEEKLERYDFLRLTFADINGIPRGKVVPKRHAYQAVMEGISAYGGIIALGALSDVADIERIDAMGHGNCRLVPDRDTLHPAMWACQPGYRVGQVLCETYWIQPFTNQEACPRYVARQQLDRLEALGYELLSSFEWEFRIQDAKTDEWVFRNPDAYCTQMLSHMEKKFCDLDRSLYAAGVDIETLEVEYGSGMYEMAMKPQKGIATADQSFILKSATKEFFMSKGLKANFMAKPVKEESGNGAHFNHSIWSKSTGKSLMYDESRKPGMSKFMEHWLAGLVRHANAVAVLCAPTIHCYRRYHQPWAPGLADWGIENREVSIRAKVEGERGTFLENRMPSGQCNPYVVLAAVVAAGLDGVEQKLELTPEADKQAPPLPHTLEEGLLALEQDTVIVKALGEEFVEWFVKIKRNAEIKIFDKGNPNMTDQEKLQREIEMYQKLM